MNFYIIVEGSQTELQVYPAWLALIAPKLKRVYDAWDVDSNCYYLFSGGGIPSIFRHVAHAVEDINSINKKGGPTFDFLLVLADTEDESREYLFERINEQLADENVHLDGTQLLLFEQKVCIESWFLGNNRFFKDNPQDPDYISFIRFYNVGQNDPEEMGNYDSGRYSTKAIFHFQYLRKVFSERHLHYSKTNPRLVCTHTFLAELVKRYESTGHIASFGRWFSFMKQFSIE